MTITAIPFWGCPPAGLGVYCRDTVLTAPFRWRAIHAGRHDVASQIQAAKSLGPTWLWRGPDSWRPGVWGASLAQIVGLCTQYDCEGVIIDAENGWPDIDRPRRRAELTAFGRGLSSVSSRVRVGFSSYPDFPDLDALATAAGQGVWGTYQAYGRTTVNPADFASWDSRWKNAFGITRVIPSIAAWQSSSALGSPSGYRAYLDAIPKSHGAIAWPPQGRPPQYMLDALAHYSPGGIPPGTAILSIIAFTARPVVIAIVALLAIIAFVLGWRL